MNYVKNNAKNKSKYSPWTLNNKKRKFCAFTAFGKIIMKNISILRVEMLWKNLFQLAFNNFNAKTLAVYTNNRYIRQMLFRHVLSNVFPLVYFILK